MREAEIAMVRAKGDPAHRHFLFEPSMSDQTVERVDLENDLRQALTREELRLQYQPLVDLRQVTCSASGPRGSTRHADSCRRWPSSPWPRRPA